VCIWATPLTGGRVCNLLLQFAVPLGSKSRRTRGRNLLSRLRVSQSRRSGPRIYIPQGQGGPVIAPVTGLPFRRLLRVAGIRWRYSNSSSNGSVSSEVKVILRPAVTRPVSSGIRPSSGIRDQFFFLFHGICLQTFVFISLLCYGAPSVMRGKVCHFSVRLQ
jgi:hypothetical protein